MKSCLQRDNLKNEVPGINEWLDRLEHFNVEEIRSIGKPGTAENDSTNPAAHILSQLNKIQKLIGKIRNGANSAPTSPLADNGKSPHSKPSTKHKTLKEVCMELTSIRTNFIGTLHKVLGSKENFELNTKSLKKRGSVPRQQLLLVNVRISVDIIATLLDAANYNLENYNEVVYSTYIPLSDLLQK